MIPAVPSGTYTITVTLSGFKTAVLNDVPAAVAQTVSVKAVLELGDIQETIVVAAASEIVQTQATSVSTTLSQAQIANLPVVGRGAFELVGLHARGRDDDRQPPRLARSTACPRAPSTSPWTA